MRIVFIGDIMLGRNVRTKYESRPYSLFSEDVLKRIASYNLRIANLESPITAVGDDDSLKFGGSSELLNQVKWIDCFSLSNNHINDFGTHGMNDTINNLNATSIPFNGLFKDSYMPFISEQGTEKIAVVTCTDMMNIEFDSTCPYKTLRVSEPETVATAIQACRANGFFTILFAHIGMLFSRFPSPASYDFLHQMVDAGVNCIVTVHSHCLGCHEEYKGVHIFHSIGDFLMDGSSFRRRQSCLLELSIDNHCLTSWSIIPTQTTMDLQVIFPDEKETAKIIRNYYHSSKLLSDNSSDYSSFYKGQYRKDMLAHSYSTLYFELKRRGLLGLLRILRVRVHDVFGMVKRVIMDRSKMSYDTDGVDQKHKMSNKDIQ